MASGVPILTTKVGMAPDLVTDGVNGGLVEVEDARALARRAVRVASDLEYAQSLIQGGQETVGQFDWSRIGKQHWQQVYQPMLKRLS